MRKLSQLKPVIVAESLTDPASFDLAMELDWIDVPHLLPSPALHWVIRPGCQLVVKARFCYYLCAMFPLPGQS